MFFVFPNIYLAAKLNPREKFKIWPSEKLNARENKFTRKINPL